MPLNSPIGIACESELSDCYSQKIVIQGAVSELGSFSLSAGQGALLFGAAFGVVGAGIGSIAGLTGARLAPITTATESGSLLAPGARTL